MILLDTNVLVYATDTSSPHHGASRRLVDAVIGGSVPGAIVTQVLVEYVAATTGSLMRSPLPVGEALSQAGIFRAQIRSVDAPPASFQHLAAILTATGRAGRRTFDAYLAAQALALGISTICTYNGGDFSGIQGLTVVSPDDVEIPETDSE